MTVQTDFYVPDFLINVNGTSFRYGTNVDIVSVSITETVNQADSFSITVRERNPNPERFASNRLIWLDNHLFDEGGKVNIEMGYLHNRALKLSGLITGMSASFPESGVPMLTVRGASNYEMLHRTTRRKPFDSNTDSGVAREIATELGLTAEVDEVDVQHPLVSPNGAPYSGFLLGRAKRLNYEVKIQEETLIFKRPSYFKSSDASLSLAWGHDLRSFTPTISTHNIPTKVEVRNTQTGLGGDKTPLAYTAPSNSREGKSILGKKGALEIVQESQMGPKENHVLMLDQGLVSNKEARLVALAELERRLIEYINARGACIGNPQLVSRTVIELKGLGIRFSGRYYVTSTTHTIDAGGYRTEFEAKRDGVCE